jgi:hypothetical protein
MGLLQLSRLFLGIINPGDAEVAQKVVVIMVGFSLKYAKIIS